MWKFQLYIHINVQYIPQVSQNDKYDVEWVTKTQNIETGQNSQRNAYSKFSETLILWSPIFLHDFTYFLCGPVQMQIRKILKVLTDFPFPWLYIFPEFALLSHSHDNGNLQNFMFHS
jgi:hypothetical protein